MQLVVATIGRAHGLRGDVAVDLRTDTPEVRFAVGTVLQTAPPDAGPLTVARTRSMGDRWFLAFDDVTDRTAAEALRGLDLVVDAEDSADDEDAWYPHEPSGSSARRPASSCGYQA